jgi:ABC-type multidrug transport system fused ATPase/permease subunit
LFLDIGCIVERCYLDNLMALGGRYKELYDLQAGKNGGEANG